MNRERPEGKEGEPSIAYYPFNGLEFELKEGEFLRECAWCGKVKTSQGWIEVNKTDKPNLMISHAICPPCDEGFRNDLEALK